LGRNSLSAGDAEEGRHRQEDQPPQIAPYLRHQPAQRRGRTGGHQGPAGPREHQYHPDLYQRRAGADGKGGGEVVNVTVWKRNIRGQKARFDPAFQ